MRASSTMTPISVVIPSYNAVAFIADAIASVLRQTRGVAEVIVVDDGSTDGTPVLVESLATAAVPIHCIRAATNGGPATARNIGVAAATSPLIAFLDADDWWEPEHCAVLGGLLDEHPDAVLAYSRWHGVSGPLPQSASALPSESPADARWALLDDNLVLQSAVLVRTEAFWSAGGYTEGMRHAEDYELWMRMARVGPFVASRRSTCVHRVHEGQVSRATVQMVRAAWGIRERARADLASAGDAATAARADAILRAAFDRDLASAWHSRDRAMIQEIVSGAPQQVQGMEALTRRWRRKLRFVWPLWRMAAAVWDTIPRGVRANLRSRRSLPAAAVRERA